MHLQSGVFRRSQFHVDELRLLMANCPKLESLDLMVMQHKRSEEDQQQVEDDSEFWPNLYDDITRAFPSLRMLACHWSQWNAQEMPLATVEMITERLTSLEALDIWGVEGIFPVAMLEPLRRLRVIQIGDCDVEFVPRRDNALTRLVEFLV